MNRRAFHIVIVLASVMFLSGCVRNLPAVRSFADTTLVASRQFENIADDLPASCIRSVDIDYSGNKIQMSDDGEDGEKAEYSSGYLEQLGVCDGARESLVGILDANDVLQGYVEALGSLASDEPVTFSAQIGALRTSLGNINLKSGNPFQGEKADAVSKLAEFLVKVSTEGYRQKKLKETIRAANPYFGDLIEGLSGIVEDYKLYLDDERGALRDAETDLIKKFKAGESAEINDQLFQVKQLMDYVEAKKAAASEYQTLLGNIADTHEKIVIGANKLDSEELAASVQGYVRELLPILKNLKRAFK